MGFVDIALTVLIIGGALRRRAGAGELVVGQGERRVKGDELVRLAIVASTASGEYPTAAVASFVMVAGEPVPREKRAGDPVYAGALYQRAWS